MKDIFSKRSRETFFETLGVFLESLTEHFGDCKELSVWNEWYKGVQTDEQSVKGVEEWVAALDEPLKKKGIRYTRAVTSITGKPATVYHAIMYHDMNAVTITSPYFASLGLLDKVQSLKGDDQTILWQYLEDLTATSYKCVRRTPGKVPSTDEISADIKKRKGTTTTCSEPALKTGLEDMWKKLCDMRNVPAESQMGTECVTEKLNELSKLVLHGTPMSDLCNEQSEEAYAAIAATFPMFDKSTCFSSDEWVLFEKCLSLALMHSNIPTPMMKGIENVANKLMADIQNGKADLASLDVESIGQQVLSGVSPSDMNEFAKNIDKILPAMRKM